MQFLFICAANRLRSPTAEHVARLRWLSADSAGVVAEWALRQKLAKLPGSAYAAPTVSNTVCDLI